MRTFLLASAALLSLGCGTTALVAQDAATTAVVLSTDQQGMYQTWPADQRTSYDGWPGTYQTYYWTLTPGQQTAWWRLSDEQRGQVYGMTPEQRMAAWSAIEAQVVSAPVGATAVVDATSPAATMATATVVTNAVPPPPADSMNKTYPVCTSKLQDSCQNPGEGGARGRSRATNRRR